MSDLAFLKSYGLVASALLVALILVSDNRVDGRDSSGFVAATPYPSGQRKPPFNGSIFGKRSNLPAHQGASYPESQMNSETFGGEDYVLALLLHHQEALAKATINRCMGVRRSSGVYTNALCDEILTEGPKGGTSTDGSWLGNLVN